MTTKNKILLLLSVLTFFGVLLAMLQSFGSVIVYNTVIEPFWVFLWFLVLLLPIFNLIEVIKNKDDWNKYYWVSLYFNIMSIAFVMKYYKIDFF